MSVESPSFAPGRPIVFRNATILTMDRAAGETVVHNQLRAEEVARTVEYARGTMGEDAWRESLTPELPTAERIPNPYTYTDFDGGEARHRAQA
jgi:hypothetical protein